MNENKVVAALMALSLSVAFADHGAEAASASTAKPSLEPIASLPTRQPVTGIAPEAPGSVTASANLGKPKALQVDADADADASDEHVNLPMETDGTAGTFLWKYKHRFYKPFWYFYQPRPYYYYHG